VKEYDPQSGHYYYYNTEENRSTWEEPADFIEGGDCEEMKAVLRIQCSFRAKVARRKAKRAKGIHANSSRFEAQLMCISNSSALSRMFFLNLYFLHSGQAAG
jgi:hypothetical protein